MLNKERLLTHIDIIVSQSDLEGTITYANPIFYRVAGYKYGELIGKNHNIIRHPDMPKVIFKLLWEQLKRGEEVYCFIKNRAKDRGFYWVFAYIRPSFNKDKTVRNYISTRRIISSRARDIIEPLYRELLDIEKIDGVLSSEKVFRDFIEQNSYGAKSINEVICNIQY
jgi:PAS domain S-box-containing protein